MASCDRRIGRINPLSFAGASRLNSQFTRFLDIHAEKRSRSKTPTWRVDH